MDKQEGKTGTQKGITTGMGCTKERFHNDPPTGGFPRAPALRNGIAGEI